jgi:ABC-type antimicrobial peptide transport system permease subunit
MSDEEFEARENSNIEMPDSGMVLMLSERADLASLPDYEMKAGRSLQPGDEGEPRVLLRDSVSVAMLGIEAGDRLLFRFYNGLSQADDVFLMLRVVGIISLQSERTGLEDAGNLLIVPPGTLSEAGVQPQSVISMVMVDQSDPTAMRRAKNAVTDIRGGVLAVEVSALTEFLENLLNQLKAIPTLVAWLALMAGTAIIANTVALAAQERRREIGVMKAVGLKGWRVLGLLMVENGLIGLLAGLIGAGVGFLVTVIIVLASQDPSELKNTIVFSTMGWLVLMSIGVAMGAAALSAWSAAAEKPMNVLRYE